MNFVILDIETTGLSKYCERITEFSGLKAELTQEGLIIRDVFSTLINPGKPIPRFITKLTGISNDMVRDAPSFAKIAPQIHSFIGDAAIVAHNATFDCGFLENHFREAGLSMPQSDVLCTRRLSRKAFPNLDSYSLGALCRHLEIDHINAHRAEQDVKVTFQLFQKISEKIELSPLIK